MYSRDGAVHGCRRDDHISSQRSRKLDDRFSSNQVYDDCEESIEPRENPQPIPCESQKHCKDHELIVSAHHENVLNPRISKQKQIFTLLKNVLLISFHELFSLSCALKEIWSGKEHETKLLRTENQFDFVHVEKFLKLGLSLSFPNSFTALHDFKTSKPKFGTQG